MKKYSLFLLLVLLSGRFFQCQAENISPFCLKAGKSVTVVCDTVFEAKVVSKALGLWRADCQSVLSTLPSLTSKMEGGDIWIGTLGSAIIQQLLSEKLLSVSELSGRKEAFLLCVLQRQSKPILVVVGSDKRGTAYGILELSRLMGVSPWEWWADVTPSSLEKFELKGDYHSFQSPTVEFRGIFINDEDWGIMRWSSFTYEPGKGKGHIGPKTYQRIFELLLRLRANTCWPAMHRATYPFFLTPGNKEMADDYGIYIGTSHCEPMLRNANGEWQKEGQGEYDYVNNSRNVYRFWEKRVADVAEGDNIYTLGMRGIHDGKMQGAKTMEQQKNTLSRIFEDQRQLLKKYINNDVTKVPQVFIPYKEVLDVYNAGLKVPDDVTLMWCDDNYGYIRHFPDSIEKARSGGNGIYYHTSYMGRPHDYLWIGTTNTSLIYQQMKLAYDSGIQKMWILNVGDIKPAEYQIEFFLDMAWDLKKIETDGVTKHLSNWLEREFGSECAQRLLPVIQEHHRLSYIRKPEFMGNTREEEGKAARVVRDFPWSEKYIKERIKSYESLSDEVEKIASLSPVYRQDAYFQLIKYPIQAAAQMNRKLLMAQLARHDKADWQQSDAAFDSIVALTNYYNNHRGKKWSRMMHMTPHSAPVFNRIPQERAITPLVPDCQSLYCFNGGDYIRSFMKVSICEGLGYGGKALSLKKGSSVSYAFGKIASDSICIEVRLLPNHPVEGDKLRFSVSIDDSPAQIFEYQTKGRSEEWKQNVLRNQAIRQLTIPVNKDTKHCLTITAIDAGVVVDQVLIYEKNIIEKR